MKRVICLLLSLSLVTGMGLSAAAQQTPPQSVVSGGDNAASPVSSDGAPLVSSDASQTGGSQESGSSAADPDSSSSSSAADGADRGASSSEQMPSSDGASSADDGEEPSPSSPDSPSSGDDTNRPDQENPAGEGLFQLEGVEKTTSPSPLTAQGGTIRLTVRGTHLEKENIWIKVEKDGAPYQTVRCAEYDGLWETVKNGLLSFAGQNVTRISTGDITLTPGGAESFAVYQIYVLHTPDSDAPGDSDPGWALWPEAGVVLPKTGAEESAGDATLGESQESSGAAGSESVSGASSAGTSSEEKDDDEYIGVEVPGDEDVSSDAPDENATVGESDGESVSSGGSGQNGEQDANGQDQPNQPEKPRAQIGAVEVSLAPEPLTYAGGGATVRILGDDLDVGSVWVRMQAPGQKTQIARAQGDRTQSAAPRFDLPENLSGKSVFYTVSVLTSPDTRKPGEEDPDWRDAGVGPIEVPAANGSNVQEETEQKALKIDSVQSVTTPNPMTHAGGVVTVAAAGTGFGRKTSLWVRLDSGSETVTKKMPAMGSASALSPEIKIAANETDRAVTYKVSVLAYDGIGTPGAAATGWKRYSQADITVPPVPAEQAPEISDVTWEETKLDGGPGVVFHVAGQNLDSGNNSVWIKAVPRDDPRSPKILRAGEELTPQSASTLPLSTKAKKSLSQKTKQAGETRYDVYALARTNEKKPDADDKGWKRYGYSQTLTPDAEPRVRSVKPDTAALPSEGGKVQLTVEGENLDALDGEDFFIRLEKVTADGARPVSPVDKNVRGGTASFDIPANTSPTHEESYRYSTFLNARMKEWGVITVSRGLGVRVETYNPDGRLAPLTAEGGAVRCVVEGDSASGSVWIKVSGNGREEIRFASETFLIDPNDSPTDAQEITVSMTVSPTKPAGYGREWETLETLTLPAVNDGHPEASVSSAYIESTKITSAGGKITATFEGENLDAQGLRVFARLRALSEGDYPDIIRAADRAGEFRASSVLEIPENTSPLARRYALEYCLSYSKEPPAGTVWMTAAIPVESREVVQPRALDEATPFIESAGLGGDAVPVSNTGGKITVDLYGTNLDREHVWVNMRCAQDPTRDDIRIADAHGAQNASAAFAIRGSDSGEQLSYRVYALTSASDDVNAVSALGGWKEIAAFGQSPKTGAPKITQIDVDASSVTDGSGTAAMTVRGVNLKNKSLWAQVEPVEGSDAPAAVLPVSRAAGTEEYRASFPVEQENTDTAALYRVSVLASGGKEQPAQEAFESGVSTVFPVGTLRVTPAAGLMTLGATGNTSSQTELRPSALDYDYSKSAADNYTQLRLTLGDSSKRNETFQAKLGDDGAWKEMNRPSEGSSTYWVNLTVPKVQQPAAGEEKIVVSYPIYIDGMGATGDQVTVTYNPPKEGEEDSSSGDETQDDLSDFTITAVNANPQTVESEEKVKITVTLGQSGLYARGGFVYIRVGPETTPYTQLGWESEFGRQEDSRVFWYDQIAVPDEPGTYPVYVQLTKDSYVNRDRWRDCSGVGGTVTVTARSTSDGGGGSDNTSSGSEGYDPSDSGSSGSSSSGGSDDGDKDSNVNGDDLDDAIDGSDANDDDEIIIDIDDTDLTVSRSFFEKAEDCDKDIILRGDDYEWKIPAGSRIRSNIKRSYNLTVKVRDTRYEREMQDLAGADAEILPFYIKYHGSLPCRMVLTLKDTDYSRRTDVWVYRYNEDSDSATLIAEETTGTDGKVSFYMSSCSYYFVSDQRVVNARRDEKDIDDYWFVDKEDLNSGDEDEWTESSSKRNPGTGARAHTVA